MHFDLYLKRQLEKYKLSKSTFSRIMQLNRSTITHYTNKTRSPTDNDCENMIKIVKYFSKSKSQQAKDLHFIFFGE